MKSSGLKIIAAFIFALITTGVFAQADSTSGKYILHARGCYGFVIAHRPALEPLQEEHVKGFELSLSKPSDGTADWQRSYNYPECGLTLAAFDLGNRERLGYGIAFYPFIDFSLIKNKLHGLHLRYGMGIGYVRHTFDAESNIKNAAIGTHINGIIHIDVHYENIISSRTSFEIGTGVTHFSNGGYGLPNLGINIAQINLAFRYSIGNKKIMLRNAPSPISRKAITQVYTGGFFKRVYPPDGKAFFAMTLSGLRLKPVNAKSSLGAGGDIFYDASIAERKKLSGELNPEAIKNFRLGIYGAYQLSLGHVGLAFNLGYYLYNDWHDDGTVYQRISVKYYFEKIFLCINLKSHYARADFLEMGIGYRFIKK